MLGERLRELRQARGLSLRALAEQAGVSAGLLSQIERGLVDPSLATLRSLADVFGESVARLFEEPEVPTVWISKPGERMRLHAPRGRISYDRLTPGNGQLEVLQADLAPGDVSAPEARPHPSIECAVVLDGVVTVEVDGRSYEVLAGEAITFDSRQPHRYVNRGPDPARLMIAITPPSP